MRRNDGAQLCSVRTDLSGQTSSPQRGRETRNLAACRELHCNVLSFQGQGESVGILALILAARLCGLAFSFRGTADL